MTFEEFQITINLEYPDSEIETWIYNNIYHFRLGVIEGAFLTQSAEWFFKCGSQGWGNTLKEAIANERQNYEADYKQFCLST